MTEVLSPVGSEECLAAAVRAGADAVYFGAGNFNARRNAGNFDENGIKEAVRYCHVRGVKAYLALNTILSDSELPDALQLAATAYSFGIDGVIVQDLGLARLLHGKLPALPLHASTQMSVHSTSALLPLKEMGFCRVVAAREMSRENLTELCEEAAKLSMSVEVFVHGALCMSVSGQCYLSAMLGGRSGNRGLCAGPCRLPFEVTGGTGHDLSLKDLSLVKHITELKKMGVASLKIEGRMKRPEYVAAATAVIRKTVDGEDCCGLEDTLKSIFSRSGFTDGYYTGKTGRDMFGIRTRDDVELSASVINSLHELYRAERASVPIFGYLSLKAERQAVLEVSDGTHSVTVRGDVPQPAINRSVTAQFAESQLKKTGGTPFYFENIRVEVDDAIAYSAGGFNALRREALAALENLRYETRESRCVTVSPVTSHTAKKLSLVGMFSDTAQVPDDVSALSFVVLPVESDFGIYSGTAQLCVSVPRGIENEKFIIKRLVLAKNLGVKYAFCGNIAAVKLVKEAGLVSVFDFSMNIFNTESIMEAKRLGAAAVTVSPELTVGQINALGGELPRGIFAYGRQPLMLLRNCPLKNGRGCSECDKKGTVKDRLNIEFPIRCRAGFSQLLNSKPTYLAERLNEFHIDFATLFFTDESREQAATVIKSYKIGSKPTGEYTRGLYYRGVE